jgi:hypothetical protein
VGGLAGVGGLVGARGLAGAGAREEGDFEAAEGEPGRAPGGVDVLSTWRDRRLRPVKRNVAPPPTIRTTTTAMTIRVDNMTGRDYRWGLDQERTGSRPKGRH